MQESMGASFDMSANNDGELTELVSSLVCILENDTIVAMNPAGHAMVLGSADETLLGRPFTDFVAHDYLFLLEAGWDLLAEEDVVPLKLKRLNGENFDAEMRVRPLDATHERLFIEVRDISKYVKSAQALREREERLQGILQSVAEGIITVTESGIVESANKAAEKMFSVTLSGLIGQALGSMIMECNTIHAPGKALDSVALKRLLVPGEVTEGIGLRQDGSSFDLEIACSEVRHGRAKFFTAILRDISERKENEERIRRLAHHDNLTGLPNRNLLHDRSSQSLARVKRNGNRLAVLYVDLDKFKPINDQLGHKAGDIVLMEVAHRLVATIRHSDTVARVGGDEFIVVLEDVIRPSEAAKIAAKIVERLSQPFNVLSHSCTIGASVGIALYPDDGVDLDEVFKAADIAMYQVKNTGRNGYCLYGDTRDREHHAHDDP